MNTRIVFLEDGKPAQNLKVKRRDSIHELITNEDGQLALELSEGNQELVVYHDGSWVPHIINVQQNSSLLLVDLEEKSKQESQAQNTPTAEVDFLDIGRLDLGERYVFQEMLGHGGMGLVIRALDRLLNRSVAIKLLSEELRDNDEAQQIFLAEARHLATLTHPNLVAVHDISKVNDRVFMVIEYVKGETIERLVQSLKRLSEPVALKLAIQLTRVVAYLHDHGIIHRDLKPANAMVRNDGTLKLVDFGLARHFDELYIRGTRVRGTPAYMSPEQIKGEHLTPASDIYQLGVFMFEMCTGRLPFDRGDVSYSHVHEEPPRVRDFNPKISPELDELIDLCLRKPTNQRPKSTHQLLQMLQTLHRAVDGDEIDFSTTPGAGEGAEQALQQARLRISELEMLHLPEHHTDPNTQAVNSEILLDGLSASNNQRTSNLDLEKQAPIAPVQIAPSSPEPTTHARSRAKPNTLKYIVAAALLLGIGAAGAFIFTRNNGDADIPNTVAATEAPSSSASEVTSPGDDAESEEERAAAGDPEETSREDTEPIEEAPADNEEVVQAPPTQTTPTAEETDLPAEETAPEVVAAPSKVASKRKTTRAPAKKANPTPDKTTPEEKKEPVAKRERAAPAASEKERKKDGLFGLSKKPKAKETRPKTTKGLLPMK